MRTRALSLLCGVTALVTAACASSGGSATAQQDFDPNAPIACIDIDNRQGGGLLERVFLVGLNSGQRQRIGDAPVGRVTSFCTQSAVFGSAHYILVERPSADNIDPARMQNQARAMRTIDFILEDGDRWVYDVRRDRFDCVPNGARGGDC
ncbi:MAG: hypothetical protein HKN71_05430 [Gemmatimonadetes bacterium]|nr:hypothetical protein [Gemmatimonadota bacterium]